MSRLLPALGAAVLLAGSTSLQATTLRHHRVQPLPPISGSIHLAPGEFGTTHRTAPPPVLVRRRPRPAPDVVEVVRGGLEPQVSTTVVAAPLAEVEAAGPASTDLATTRRWASGGTGVSGIIGNTGNPFAGEAAWGTADSATTGIAGTPRFADPPRIFARPRFALTGTEGAAPRPYALRAATARRGLFTSGAIDRPLTDIYGDPPIRSVAYDLPAYGTGPAVPFYGAGTPGTLSYYSAGSAAGPYGSPGGLGVYRSGSYGYGPRVIRIGGAGPSWARGRCTCGPRIVHLAPRRRF